MPSRMQQLGQERRCFFLGVEIRRAKIASTTKQPRWDGSFRGCQCSPARTCLSGPLESWATTPDPHLCNLLTPPLPTGKVGGQPVRTCMVGSPSSHLGAQDKHRGSLILLRLDEKEPTWHSPPCPEEQMSSRAA